MQSFRLIEEELAGILNEACSCVKEGIEFQAFINLECAGHRKRECNREKKKCVVLKF